MSVTAAPTPWPPSPAARAGSWRLGREADGILQWAMPRNCSISPRQLVGLYLALCTVSLVIAVGFWWRGAPLVAVFASIELLAVGAALVVFARHAGDREVITLDHGELAIEHRFGPVTDCIRFRSEWVRVEPTAGPGSLLEVSGQGRHAIIGRYLRPQLRSDLAREIRLALRSSQA